MAVFQDAFRGVGHIQVGALHKVPYAIQLPLDLLKLGLDGLQPVPLFFGDAVHLLVHQLHQVPDVGFGEDVVADVGDDDVLEGLGVEPGGAAGVLAFFEQGLADVIGVLAALGLGGGEGLAAGLALGQAAEQVRTGGAAGMDLLGSAGDQQPTDPVELLGSYDGGEGVFDADRFGLVLGPGAPDQGAGVGFVDQHGVDGGLEPPLAAGGGDALGIQRFGNVEDGVSLEDQVEDTTGHDVLGRVEFQSGALLGAILNVDLAVAVGCAGAHPEAPGGGLAHSAGNLLPKILAVKFVHGLDDGFH